MSGDVPTDILEAARAAYRELPWTMQLTHRMELDVLTVFARAILAERERCAEIAQRLLRYADTTSAADIEIAAAIRGKTL